MSRIQHGTSVEHVTIWSAIDWLQNRACDNHRKGEACGHPGCSKIEQAVSGLEQLALGEPLGCDIEFILKLVRSKRCHGRAARSRAAVQNEPYIIWLESYLTERRKAA